MQQASACGRPHRLLGHGMLPAAADLLLSHKEGVDQVLIRALLPPKGWQACEGGKVGGQRCNVPGTVLALACQPSYGFSGLLLGSVVGVQSPDGE